MVSVASVAMVQPNGTCANKARLGIHRKALNGNRLLILRACRLIVKTTFAFNAT